MKKALFLILLVCTMALSACRSPAGRTAQALPAETLPQAQAQTVESACSGDEPIETAPVLLKNIWTGEETFLSPEDSAAVLQMLDNRGWAGDATDCAADFILTASEGIYTYRSACGTAQRDGISMTFSEASRREFNAILQAYLGLHGENIAVLDADPAYDWGVTLTAENVTAAGLTLRCTQHGDVAGELTSGTQYTLERKTAAGWKRVEYLPPEYDIGWDDMAYILPLNGETSWEINWEWLYGSLAPGSYRIGKEITHTWGERNCDRQMQYAEFEAYDICGLPLAPADTAVRCGIA